MLYIRIVKLKYGTLLTMTLVFSADKHLPPQKLAPEYALRSNPALECRMFVYVEILGCFRKQ